MKISYNWLKWYIPDAPEADKLADVFTYHLTEVEGVEKFGDDTIFDLNILPNRAHDLLSHHGVARELAGQLGIVFKDPSAMYKIPEAKPTKLQIDIQTDKCRRYSARIIRNVKIGPSPEWVKNHLESIGQRSINNIVDATNLVMFDCGQPCHAFDLDKLARPASAEATAGQGKIIIRQAAEGESITTLSGTEVKLLATDMVIADEKNMLAIAGVKGGKAAEVDDNTKNILIEVANFDPTAVRKTARRLNILTDSSKRFENDLSAELCDFAMKELSGLIMEVACPERPEGVEWEEIVDVYPIKQAEKKLSFETAFINKKLGSPPAGGLTADEVENILKNYSFTYTRNGEAFEVTVPALRLDLVIPEDMVEEIGRIYGYEKITPIIPSIPFQPKVNETFYKTLAVRQKLLDEGYSEVMTYAFTDKGDVEVLASASDKNFLRTNISDGLKHSIKLNQTNAPLLGINAVKVFEIGTVFSKNAESVHVAFGDKKNVTEMTLDEYCEKNGITVGSDYTFGSAQVSDKKFSMWSLFPCIARDIAVWVPEGTDPSELVKIFKEHGTELMVTEPRLFDTFSKEGRTSFAFSLVFQAFDRTLTDEEINKITEKIYESLKSHSGWEIR